MFGYGYDAAGNLLSNFATAMTWDAESRLLTAGGATYVYDAEGNRVEKQGVGVTDTIYFGGQPVARYSAGQWTDLVYGPNGLLAEVPGTQSAGPVYRVLDHLGTEVGELTDGSTLVNPLDYAPFGRTIAGTTNDPYQFTGKERDAESGLDYFGARMYGSSMGRFMSPDTHGGVLSNPQTLNRYAYALNNPLIFIDPTGHDCVYASQLDSNGQPTVVRGDCKSDTDDGVFYDGHLTFSGMDGAGNYVYTGSPYQPGANPYDPDGNLIYNLSAAISGQAGPWLSPQGIATFYAASALGALALPGAAGADVTALGFESPSTTTLLQGHVDAAVEQAAATVLTPAQAAAVANNPNLEAAYTGNNIDAIAKANVANDPLLGNINVTGRFQFGPDFLSPNTGQWWDVTTQGPWASHVAKYTSGFGTGTLLPY